MQSLWAKRSHIKVWDEQVSTMNFMNHPQIPRSVQGLWSYSNYFNTWIELQWWHNWWASQSSSAFVTPFLTNRADDFILILIQHERFHKPYTKTSKISVLQWAYRHWDHWASSKNNCLAVFCILSMWLAADADEFTLQCLHFFLLK